MDPFLGVLVFMLFLRTAATGVSDAFYAWRGKDHPRYKLRQARAQANGRSQTPRYGTRDYWSDLWSDFLQDRTNARRRRNADRAAEGRPPLLPGQVAVETLVRPVGTRERRPGERPSPRPRTDPPPVAPEGPVCEHCGSPLTGPDNLHPDGSGTCPTTGQPYPPRPTEPTTQPEPAPTNTQPTGGPMNTATDDATTYEGASATLAAAVRAAEDLTSHVDSAGSSVGIATDHIEQVDVKRAALAAAIEAAHAALAAKNISPEVLAPCQAALDAVSPEHIAAAQEAAEALAAAVKAMFARMEAGVAALRQAKDALDARYGDVAEQMGATDGSFINGR